MGQAARDALRERTTPGERLEIGLEMTEDAIQARIAEIDVPDGLDAEERAKFLVRKLREGAG